MGYADSSEWFIGHSGSTYWRKKDSEKAELFRKIEPYLTFLNILEVKMHIHFYLLIHPQVDVNKICQNNDHVDVR